MTVTLVLRFLKSVSGLSVQNLPRTSSFDAHALLQRDDEPTVVLDAREDWRFAKNVRNDPSEFGL